MKLGLSSAELFKSHWPHEEVGTSSRKWDTSLESWNMSKRLGEILLNTASWHLLLFALNGKYLPRLTCIFAAPAWACSTPRWWWASRGDTGAARLELLLNDECCSVQSSDPGSAGLPLFWASKLAWQVIWKRRPVCRKHSTRGRKFGISWLISFQCITFLNGLVFGWAGRATFPS